MRALPRLIGESPGMQRLMRIVEKVATSTHPVLILGESGAGKEVVARSVHLHGPHAAKPFVGVDCGSLVPGLIESELFGHVKGAFTSADRVKPGLLPSAGEGTVFLDEIGELPLDLQVKLLRALQEREVRPVGSATTVPFTARVLAATNRDLTAMVEQGSFRKDLFFRLNVVSLKIPPLRERREDIPLLAKYFVERLELERGEALELKDEVMEVFTGYDWPGNVRELENAVERLCALTTGPDLDPVNLPTQLQNFRSQQRHGRGHRRSELPDAGLASEETIVPIAELERRAILKTIRQLHGDKLMAARLLGIGKTTLYRKLKEYGVE